MSRTAILILSLCSLLLTACDEELPPQNDPRDLFVAHPTMQYRYLSDARPTRSFIDVFIVYKNLYDETLEDAVAMKGTIRIEWLATPEERGSIKPYRTDQLTMDNLFAANGYNFVTNRLSIAPGDSIVLRYRWDLKTDDSTSLLAQVKYASDKGCLIYVCGGDVGTRGVAVRQQFSVSSSFTIFQRSGVIQMPSVPFSSCWIQPNCGEVSPCDQPNPDNPCNISP